MSNYVEKEEQFEKTASRHQVLKVLSDDTIYPITIDDVFIEDLDTSSPKVYVQFEVDDATGYIEIHDTRILDESGVNILFESITGVGASSMYDIIGGTLKCNFEDTLESCTILPNEKEVSVTFGDIDEDIPRLEDCDEEAVEEFWEQGCLKSSYHSVTTEEDDVWEVDISWVTGVTDEKNAIEIHIEDEVGELVWEIKGPNSFSEDSQPAQFIEDVGQGSMEMLEGSTVCVIADGNVPNGFDKGFKDRTGEWVLLSRQWVDDLETYKEEQKKKKEKKKSRGSSRSSSSRTGISKSKVRRGKRIRNKGLQGIFTSFIYFFMIDFLFKPMIEGVAAASGDPMMMSSVMNFVELSVFLMIGGGMIAFAYGTMITSMAKS